MFNNSILYEFCQVCRKAFGLNNVEDAEELAAMIDVGIVSSHNLGLVNLRKELPVTRQPEKPKVDPAVVAAGIRTQVDYKCVPVRTYTKPITYVCASNGLFEVRHSDLATIVTRPKTVLGLVEEMKEGMTLNLPKVPFDFLRQTISFFRGVEAKMKGSSEALVQIWWDRTEGRHVIHVPEQQVSGGSVRHQSTFDQDSTGRYFHVMDIHSHGSNMSAFWSGVDDADEKRVTTERLFGVIGKVKEPIPMWKWRMRTRDGFMDLTVADVFEMPTAPINFTVTPEVLFRSMSSEASFKDGKVSLWCPVDPFVDVEVPAAWYDQVKSYSYSNNHQSHHGGYRGFGFGKDIRGFIYVDGREYEVDNGTMKPTGHSLVKKGDQHVSDK